MIDLSKSLDFFNPADVKERIHIIGCGSVGSTIAELLARFGLKNISLYDFDKVEEHNIVNQMFREGDVGKNKAVATKEIMLDINSDLEETVKIYPQGWTGQKLSGYVFLCPDDIDVRREIATANKSNMNIKAMFDVRTRLTDAQHYAANWRDLREIENFIESMNFTKEEAKDSSPVSACGVTLGVAPTVRLVCNIAVCNFLNFVKGNGLHKMILCDAFNFVTEVIG